MSASRAGGHAPRTRERVARKSASRACFCVTVSGFRVVRFIYLFLLPAARPRRCAAAAFEALLCSLPTARPAERVMPPDWAFGAEAPTLGKAMARWAMHLYLGVADSPMRRYVLDDDELDDWRWLPDTGCAAEPRPRHGWLTYDVCEAAERRLRKPQAWLGDAVTGTKGGAALLGQLQGNSSGRWRQRGGAAWMATAGGGVTSGGVWAAAQAISRLHLGHISATSRRSRLDLV